MTPEPHSPIRFSARDGAPLSMRRVRAETSPTTEPSARGAVVLQHGLGANGKVFDFPGRSIARYLADAGFDVFIPHLRGADPRELSTSYGVDAYIEHDIPAVLETVQQLSGQQRVHWVGHSMGGVLLMMYAIENPDAPIRRFIAVGSALDYRPGYSVFRDLRPLAPWLTRVLTHLPFGQLARLNALVAGYGPALIGEKMNFWRSNLEPHAIRHVLEHGFSAIPMQLLNDLDTTFAPAGFSRKAGAIAYLTSANAYRLPTCLVVGTRDEQCSESAVEATARLLAGSPELRVMRFGKRHGHADDYGHFDLIIGTRAPSETWPVMRDFLAS